MNVMYVAKACHGMRSTRIQSSTAPILTFNWILQCCTVLLRQRFEKSDVIKSIWCNLNQMHWSELISDPSFRVGWCFQFLRGKKCGASCVKMHVCSCTYNHDGSSSMLSNNRTLPKRAATANTTGARIVSTSWSVSMSTIWEGPNKWRSVSRYTEWTINGHIHDIHIKETPPYSPSKQFMTLFSTKSLNVHYYHIQLKIVPQVDSRRIGTLWCTKEYYVRVE